MTDEAKRVRIPVGKGISGTIAATARDCSHDGDEIHAIVALTPSTIGADIEAAPVIDGGDHRRRLGVGTGGKVRGEYGRGKSNRSHRNKRNRFHLRPQLSDPRGQLWIDSVNSLLRASEIAVRLRR